MKKLAIVGTHPATRDQAPFDDPEVDIWVFNEAPQADWCTRWDACFQLHKPEVYTSRNNFVRADHWDWLQKDHGERVIWMQDADPRVPNSRSLPIDEIMAILPGAEFRWFSSSVAYAIALALFQGYEEIMLVGVDMNSNTEYGYQLPNFQFWVGVALGMGIGISLLSNREYFSSPMYGYEGEVQLGQDFFAARVELLESSWKKAESELKRAKDRLSDCVLDRKYAKFSNLVVKYQETAIAAGEVSGALAEAQRFAGRDDPITRQEFERRMATAQQEGEEKRALMYHAVGKVEYVFNVWQQTGNAEALRQVRMFLGEHGQHAFDTGGRLGIHHENLYYMQSVDARITAAGGQKTLEALGVSNG